MKHESGNLVGTVMHNDGKDDDGVDGWHDDSGSAPRNSCQGMRKAGTR